MLRLISFSSGGGLNEYRKSVGDAVGLLLRAVALTVKDFLGRCGRSRGQTLSIGQRNYERFNT